MKESQTSVSFPLLGFPDFPMTLPIHNSSVIQVPKSDDATWTSSTERRSRRSTGDLSGER